MPKATAAMAWQHTIAATMNDSDLCWMSAADLAAAIAKKKVSPVQVVDAVLSRIDTPGHPRPDAEGSRGVAIARRGLRAAGQRRRRSAGDAPPRACLADAGDARRQGSRPSAADAPLERQGEWVNERRDLFTPLGGFVTWPRVAGAQQSRRTPPRHSLARCEC